MKNICENCQTMHDGLFGSGRFCTEWCARSFATKNTKEWEKIFTCSICGKDVARNKRASKNSVIVLCDICKTKSAAERKILLYNNGISRWIKCRRCDNIIVANSKNGLCRTCLHKDNNYRKSISDSIKLNAKLGKHKGWPTRSKLQASYAEKFFMRVLNYNNIKYTRELKVDKYFIDFAIENKKIALEIDGKQHEYADRIESDKLKNATLKNYGWKVYRIKWKNINTEKGKLYIKEEIKNFLEMYNTSE